MHVDCELSVFVVECCLLLIAFGVDCWLVSIGCVLFMLARCVSFAGCCLLVVVCGLLLGVLLYVVCYSLFVVWCLVIVVC